MSALATQTRMDFMHRAKRTQAIGQSHQVDAAFRICEDMHFPHDPAGGKFNSSRRTWGGWGMTACPWLQQLGVQVNAMGFYTESHEPARDDLVAHGVHSYMTKVAGMGATNAIIGTNQPTVLRVTPPPLAWSLTTDEADHLVNSSATAIVLGGSLDALYAESLIGNAAALEKSVFWNASRSANLKLASVGNVHIQISYAEWGNAASSDPQRAKPLADRLFVASGAKTVICTDAQRGAYGVSRLHPEGLFAPAIQLPANLVRKKLGAGDAHHAGMITMQLYCAEATRLEQCLHLGRLLAAHHCTGKPPCGWSALGAFEAQYYHPRLQSVRAA